MPAGRPIKLTPLFTKEEQRQINNMSNDNPFKTEYTHKSYALPTQIMGAVIADDWEIELTEEQLSTAYILDSPEMKKVIKDATG